MTKRQKCTTNSAIKSYIGFLVAVLSGLLMDRRDIATIHTFLLFISFSEFLLKIYSFSLSLSLFCIWTCLCAHSNRTGYNYPGKLWFVHRYRLNHKSNVHCKTFTWTASRHFMGTQQSGMKIENFDIFLLLKYVQRHPSIHPSMFMCSSMLCIYNEKLLFEWYRQHIKVQWNSANTMTDAQGFWNVRSPRNQ